MKRAIRSLAVCAIVAASISIANSLLLVWCSRLPGIGPVPLSVACERRNTIELGIEVFAVVFGLGIISMLFRYIAHKKSADG